MTNNHKIKCLVIDDEMPAREILKKYISSLDSFELSGTCDNAVEALSFLQNHTVDLMFIDIQMPKILGTDFIRTLKNPPRVIFTTAYRKFAVEGFELDAVDYLLKPISFERFLKAVNKVLQVNHHSINSDNTSEENKRDQSNPFLYFRADRKMVKVFLNDILFVEGMKDYIKIVTESKPIISKHLISTLEGMLPKDEFIRIHRSFIAAINKIQSFNSDSVEIGKKKLPIGRLFKHDVERTLKSSEKNLTK